MKLNVVVVVIGLVIAAIVGVAASLLAQPALSQTPRQTAAPGVVVETVKSELAGFEERLNARNDALAGEVESCAFRLNAIEKSLRDLKGEIATAGGVAGLPVVAGGGESTQTGHVDAGALRRVVETIDKEREEIRAEEKRLKKEQKTADKERKLVESEKVLTGLVAQEVSRVSKEKGWPGAKSGKIEAVLLQQTRKMFELYREDLHGGSPDMRQFYEETKGVLLQEMTQEELNELASGMSGPLGSSLRKILHVRRKQPSQPPSPR